MRQEVEALLRFDAAAVDPLAGALADLLGDPDLEPPELAEQQLLGPYRLLGVLGRGGLGTVYAAERADGQFERKVAVKVVRRHLISTQMLADLRRERQILARLEHPNIARLYDGGEDAHGRPFLAMELVEGVPIDRYCELHTLPLRRRLRLFLDLCGAVAHAHGNLVIHRDIKPSNVLVTADAVPKLLDFGIALPVRGEPSGGRGPRAFTPDYASPEQIAGEALTTATDVYSLGVLLYRLLSGLAPYTFAGTLQPAEIKAELRRGPARLPSQAARQAGATDWRALELDLDAITCRAMAYSPEHRYASVELLAEDLRRHLEMVPVSAVDGGWTYRAGRFLRRHRLSVGAAALGLVALTGATVATSWALVQAHRARATTEEHLAELRSEQRRSTAMIDSFVDTFRLADPGEARGETITVRQLVDRSVAALPPAASSTDPELSARMAETFGEIYLNLGAPRQAESLFARALPDGTEQHEPAHLFHWRTRALLAEAQIDQGRAASAARDLRQAIREHRQRLGNRGLGLAHLVHTLGVAQLEQDDDTAAAALFRQAIWLIEEDPATAGSSLEAMESRHRLAQAVLRGGALDEAEALLRQVFEFRRHELGEDHPTTVTALGDLAAVALYAGQAERAADLFAQVLERHRSVFGGTHPHVATALQNLATAQRRLGQNELARQNLIDVVALRRELHGPSHPAVADALYGLARLEHQSQKFDQAESHYRQAYEIRRDLLGDEHPRVAMALLGLADLAWSRDRLGEAERLYRRVQRRLEAAGKGDSLDAAFPSHQLGILLLRLGDTAGGCAWLDKAAATRLRLLGPEHPHSQRTRAAAAPCKLEAVPLREPSEKSGTSDPPPAPQS